MVLRQFRDRCLLTNAAGRAFVRFYYRHSPPLAAWLAPRAWARSVVRVALLPLYGVAWLLLNPAAGAGLVFLLGLCLALARGRRRPARLAVPAAAAFLLLAAAPAWALDVNHFAPAPGEDLLLRVRTSKPLESGRLGAGLFLNYADDPLEGVVGGVSERISKSQGTAVLSLAYGLTPDFQLGLSFPYLFTQSSSLGAGLEPEDSGPGDLRLEGKYRLRGGKDQSGFALVPFIVLETGDDEALVSADAGGVGLLLVFDYNWCNHSVLSFNLGYQYQSARYYPNFKVKHGLLFGLGAGKLLADGKTSLALEVSGRADDDWFGGSEATPVELTASLTRRVAERMSLTLGAGAGLTKGYGAPDYRVFLGLRGLF